MGRLNKKGGDNISPPFSKIFQIKINTFYKRDKPSSNDFIKVL